MVRGVSFLALGVAALVAFADQVSAQIILQPGQVPKIDPNLQRKIQEAFQGAGAGLGQPGIRGSTAGMSWGGMRLEKPSPELQAQLGLDEKEGLVVASVAANSPAAKAGVKATDVLLKIGKHVVPRDADGFAKLVKEQKENEPIDLVVIRKGKEEAIKGAKMPVLVQGVGGAGGGGGGAIGGVGGIGRGPAMVAKLKKLHLELEFNGGDLVKDQDGEKFTGSYTKDTLKITIAGKIENGQSNVSEITVTEGKETKKYTSPRDVPAKHYEVIRQLMPSPPRNLMVLPFADVPAVPIAPRLLLR